MWKEEWEFWTSDPDLTQLPADEYIIELLLKFARNNLPPLRDQIDLADAGEKVAPCIRLVAAPGTHPVTWPLPYPRRARNCCTSRIQCSITSNWRPPPFPCLGSVVQKGEGWQWQPIEIAHD
jgi:hypothetical protein